MLDAENRAVELGLFGILEALDLLAALLLDQFLDVFGIFADPVDQTGALTAPVFIRHAVSPQELSRVLKPRWREAVQRL